MKQDEGGGRKTRHYVVEKSKTANYMICIETQNMGETGGICEVEARKDI